MLLKNKKTGEIKEVEPITIGGFRSLAELNEEWEDYEEPSKTIWQIKDSGELQDFEEDDFSDGYIESSKSIGNYFDTREEAEKAVEKLKAFKRLKDNGMIKYSFHKEKTGIDLDFYTLTILAPRDKDSLDLLFGGEE